MDTKARTFEFKDDKSSKFWEITQSGASVTVRYGKTGTAGQSQTKAFEDANVAAKHLLKQITEKLGKGYVEQVDASAHAAGTVNDAEVKQPGKLKVKMTKAKPAKPKKSMQDPDATPESLMALLNKDDATNRLLARHSKASPELLEKLSHSSDKATRAFVTANPNIPTADYIRLGSQFPEEFLANPILDLLLFENPVLLYELPDNLLIQVLRRPSCPHDFLVWAAQHGSEKVQLAVAMNAKAPEESTVRLQKSSYRAVKDVVSSKQTLQVNIANTERLFQQAVKDWLGTLSFAEAEEAWKKKDIGLAQFPYLPTLVRLHLAGLSAEQLVTLNHAQSSLLDKLDALCVVGTPPLISVNGDLAVARVWRIVTENSNASAVELEVLATHAKECIRNIVARHPNTPISALEVLANDGDWVIRMGVAENLKSTPELLDLLSVDKDCEVRQAVAKNINTPFTLLEVLAKDDESFVRESVAKNPNTPVKLLEVMACELAKRERGKWLLRVAVENPRNSVSELEVIAGKYAEKESNSWLQRAVAENQSTPAALLQKLYNDNYFFVHRYLASNPRTPPAILQELLVKESNVSIRRDLASNPNTPISALEVLVKDKDPKVREYLSRNPSTSISILLMLAKDNDIHNRFSVATNPNTPLAFRDKLISQLSTHKSESVRWKVAGHPSTPIAVLGDLANDASMDVRLAIIANPATPLVLANELRHSLFFGDPKKDPWFKAALAKADAATQAAVQADEVLFYAGKDPNREVLSTRTTGKVMALCSGPYVQPERIARVSVATDWLVRAAVARNAGTPPNLLKKLTADGHPLVAGLAKLTLSRADKNEPECMPSPEAFNIARVVTELASRLQKSRNTGTSRHGELGQLPTISDVWWDYPAASNYLQQHVGVSEWESLWQTFAKDDRDRLASCSNVPPALQATLAGDQSPEVRRRLARNLNTSVAVLSILAKDAVIGVRGEVGRNPNTPVALLEVLAIDAHDLVRCGVAENSKTPVALLEALSKDKVADVKSRVANNSNTPPAVLYELAKDKASCVRCGVAENSKTPKTLLEVLSKDKVSDVRILVAKSPNTPASVLQVLARDSCAAVRREVAQNSGSPDSALRVLALDSKRVNVTSSEWGEVRIGLFSNPNAPISVLIEFSKHDDPFIRRQVARNTNTPAYLLEDLAKDKVAVVRGVVAQNPNTPPAVLQVLATDAAKWRYNERYPDKSEVRFGVAQNPNAPIAALELLAKHEDPFQRKCVARHPKVSVALLEQLANDIDGNVRRRVAENAMTPAKHIESVLQGYLADIQNVLAMEVRLDRGPKQVGDLSLQDIGRWSLSINGLSLQTSNKGLTTASRSTDWLVRLGAALHPTTSDAQLQLLSQDADADVSVAAQMRLSKKIG